MPYFPFFLISNLFLNITHTKEFFYPFFILRLKIIIRLKNQRLQKHKFITYLFENLNAQNDDVCIILSIEQIWD